VAYAAEEETSGQRQQMITSVVAGGWHKTYVITGSKRLVELTATEQGDTIALLFAGGGHATLTTVPNMQQVQDPYATRAV
jgi:hypothetical protein